MERLKRLKEVLSNLRDVISSDICDLIINETNGIGTMLRTASSRCASCTNQCPMTTSWYGISLGKKDRHNSGGEIPPFFLTQKPEIIC